MNSTLTAAEVVRHAAPIAALLGVTELDITAEYVHLRGLNGEDETLGAQNAAALLLGLIVAKSHLFANGAGESSVVVGRGTEWTDEKHVTASTPLHTIFVAACAAFARAHGLTPAPTTEDTTNG